MSRMVCRSLRQLDEPRLDLEVARRQPEPVFEAAFGEGRGDAGLDEEQPGESLVFEPFGLVGLRRPKKYGDVATLGEPRDACSRHRVHGSLHNARTVMSAIILSRSLRANPALQARYKAEMNLLFLKSAR